MQARVETVRPGRETLLVGALALLLLGGAVWNGRGALPSLRFPANAPGPCTGAPIPC